MVPDDAQKVFSWVLFDVYQKNQELFDWSKTTFEYLDKKDTTQIIATVEDKIVLEKQKQPWQDWFWSLPGGRIEDNEDFIKSWLRELYEETWLTSDDVFHWKTYNPTSKINWDIYYLIARNCYLYWNQQLDGGEKIEVVYVTFEEFTNMIINKDLDLKDFAADFLRSYVKQELQEFKNLIFWNN